MIINNGNKGSSPSYEVCDSGAFVGRCIRIVDTGTQLLPWKNEDGSEAFKRELRITWELSETMQDGRPFVVSWSGTPSLNEKAALYKLLVNWRGKAFTPAELKGFDLQNLLDKTCLVNVTQSASKKDATKIFNNVSSVMQLPKGMQAPDRVNDLILFDLDDMKDDTKLDRLWPLEKKKVMGSVEGIAYFSGEPTPETTQPGEDIPF